MARIVSVENMKPRAAGPQTAKSFDRFEPAGTSPVSGRSRASTTQSNIFHSQREPGHPQTLSPEGAGSSEQSDVFEGENTAEGGPESPCLDRSQVLLERSDELPIELISLTDRSAPQALHEKSPH